MNLKNLFIPLLAVAALVSCSKDDDLGPQKPDMTPDAFLTLAVESEIHTKAEGDVEPRDVISDLAVFVYIGDKYYTHADTTLKDSSKPLTEINNIPVKAGNVKLFVVANAGKDVIKKMSEQTALEDALKIPTAGLANEKHGKLTMSSEVFSVTLRVSEHNYVGYPTVPTGGVQVVGTPIELYRNVARIQLSSLTLKETSIYGTPVSFELDSVFVANVKSKSYLCPPDGKPWGKVNYPNTDLEDADWWYGACIDQGIYGKELKKVVGGSQIPYLGYGFDKSTNLGALNVPYWDEAQSGKASDIKIEPKTLGKGETMKNTVSEVVYPIGNFFYAYENIEPLDGYKTLLVIKGSYTYIPEGSQKPVTVDNCYYTMIVNGEGAEIEGKGTESKHTGVKRNVQYLLNLTIAGVGSDKPYDPASRAYLSSTIKVLDWGVIAVEETVD